MKACDHHGTLVNLWTKERGWISDFPCTTLQEAWNIFKREREANKEIVDWHFGSMSYTGTDYLLHGQLDRKAIEKIFPLCEIDGRLPGRGSLKESDGEFKKLIRRLMCKK